MIKILFLKIKSIKNMLNFLNKSHIIGLFFSMILLISCNQNGNDLNVSKLIPVKNGEYYQYIDLEGKLVINPQFSEASLFRNGLALVKSTGKVQQWGYIAEDGRYTIMPKYRQATIFNENKAWVISENSDPMAINLNGDIMFSIKNAVEVRIFQEGLAAFSSVLNGTLCWGFVDQDGRTVILPQFTKGGDFSEGLCAVMNKDNKWGFIDKKGNLIINYQFEDVIDGFIQGQAVVMLSGKYGIIDIKGKCMVNPIYDKMLVDGESYLVENNGKFGWCNRLGKIMIDCQFDEASQFENNDLAAIRIANKYGYVNKTGKICISPQFDQAYPFNGAYALVNYGLKFGLIDENGKYIINPIYDAVSSDYCLNLVGKTAYRSVFSEINCETAIDIQMRQKDSSNGKLEAVPRSAVPIEPSSSEAVAQTTSQDAVAIKKASETKGASQATPNDKPRPVDDALVFLHRNKITNNQPVGDPIRSSNGVGRDGTGMTHSFRGRSFKLGVGKNNCNDEGKVVLEVTLLPDGTIRLDNISPLSKASDCLVNVAINYLKSSRFNESANSVSQEGTITFNFKLK
jgi:hypothetical protein